MPLAPFSISNKSAVATSQRELDALARGPIGGDPFSGPSASAMKNMKSGVGVEGLLASGLDKVIAAGLQAGEEGDYEAAAFARDFIDTSLGNEDTKKAISSALSYTGEPGRDPAKDILREQAKRFQGSDWRTKLDRLSSKATNPKSSEFEYRKTIESLGASKKNPVAYAMDLNNRWNKALGDVAIGNASSGKSIREAITTDLSANSEALQPLFSLKLTADTPPQVVEAVRIANKFVSGEYLSEKAELFDGKTNPNAPEYNRARLMASGANSDAANILSPSQEEEKKDQPLLETARTLLDGVASSNNVGPSGPSRVGTPTAGFAFYNATAVPAKDLAENLVKIEPDAAKRNIISASVSGNLSNLRPEDAGSAMKTISENVKTVDAVQASVAFKTANQAFISGFLNKSPDGKSSVVDELSLGQLQGVPLQLFTGLVSVLNQDTSLDPQLRGQMLRVKMGEAVSQLEQIRRQYGNEYAARPEIISGIVAELSPTKSAYFSANPYDEADPTAKVKADRIFAQKFLGAAPQLPDSAYAAEPEMISAQAQQYDAIRGLLSVVLRSAAATGSDVELAVRTPEARAKAASLLSDMIPGLTQEEADGYVKNLVEKAISGKPLTLEDLDAVKSPASASQVKQGNQEAELFLGVARRGKGLTQRLFGIDKPYALSGAQRDTVNFQANQVAERVAKTMSAALSGIGEGEVRSQQIFDAVKNDPVAAALLASDPNFMKELDRKVHVLVDSTRKFEVGRQTTATRGEVAFTEPRMKELLSKKFFSTGARGDTTMTLGGEKGSIEDFIRNAVVKAVDNPTKAQIESLRSLASSNTPAQTVAKPVSAIPGSAKVQAYFDKGVNRTSNQIVQSRIKALTDKMDMAYAGWGWQTLNSANEKLRKGEKIDDVVKDVIAESRKMREDLAEAKASR